MPFPFKKAGNAQQLAAQLAWDYENSESAENELDAFIDDVAAELLTMAGEGAEVNEEEQARLQRLTEAAGELRRASKEAAQQMLLGEFEAAKESLAQAEEAAARMETDLQTLREAQGPEGFAANFINNWDANDHPSKKYMALAGSYTPERMPGNMTEKEKWRWVQEQNIGEDTPYYKHEDKVNAIATALAAYKFGNDRPTPAFSERRLRSAANALKKDPVFKFLTAGEMAADTLMRNANVEELARQVSNRFIVSVDPNRYPDANDAEIAEKNQELKDMISDELDELGDVMSLDPPAKGRSKEWKALHESLADYRKHPGMSVEDRVQKVFDAIEAYGKDKKTLRSTLEGQASFDMMMRALFIVSQASPAAKARADAIVADINHSRTHRSFFRRPQPKVDLDDYSSGKLRRDVEKVQANRLDKVPKSTRSTKLIGDIENELRKQYQKYGVESTRFGRDGAQKDVTEMIARTMALSRIPKYQKIYKIDGTKTPRQVVDEEQLKTTASDLSRDPVVREMAERYMTDAKFRKELISFGTEWKELPASVIAERMAAKYASIAQEKQWVAGKIEYMANTTGRMDAEDLPELPKEIAHPVQLVDVEYQVQPFRSVDGYSDKLEFAERLEEALARHTALNFVPAYRQKDEKTGKYRKVIDADQLNAKADELKNDGALKALAKRMVDDPAYRREVLMDIELAQDMGIPEGAPIPWRSPLGLAGKLSTELMRTREALNKLPEIDKNKNEIDASVYRKEIEQNIAKYGRGYEDDNSEELNAVMLGHVANTLAYADTTTELRRQDGNIVSVTDSEAYAKKVQQYRDDPAVKALAEKYAKNRRDFYKAAQDPIQGGFRSAAEFAVQIRDEYEYIKDAPSRELKARIEKTREDNALKWQQARAAREARQAQAARIKPAPIKYDENNIPLPPGAGEEEKKAEAAPNTMMAVNVKYSTKPEDLPLPDKEIKPVELKTLRSRTTNLAKISGSFNPTNLEHVATMTGSMLTALALNTLPAWQGQVNGQPAPVADAGELDNKIAELQNDPAVQTIMDRCMKDPDYLIDLTYVRERGMRPTPRNAMKFAERMQQEVDAVRKELGPNAAAKEQEKPEEKLEKEQEGLQGPAVL